MNSRLIISPREELDRVPGIDNQCVVDVLYPFPLTFLCQNLERSNRLTIKNSDASGI